MPKLLKRNGTRELKKFLSVPHSVTTHFELFVTGSAEIKIVRETGRYVGSHNT